MTEREFNGLTVHCGAFESFLVGLVAALFVDGLLSIACF
jgi:hypothetical protein